MTHSFPDIIPAPLPPSAAPLLLVVIDTEAEFDWHGPFGRDSTSVSALREIGRAQDIFDRFGITPVYVVDYPVADHPEEAQTLREIGNDGRAQIGAHLNSWTCPPFDEALTPANSFQCNLAADLEGEKLSLLMAKIEETFGIRPVIHKAGRYGLSTQTFNLLRRMGFEYDLSLCPRHSAANEGGPDFSRAGTDPFWVGDKGGLLELPTTAGFFGALASLGPSLYPAVDTPVSDALKIKAVFSRLRLLERIRLSPEGFSLSELKRATKALIARGTRVLTFSFHSPSLAPGHTPYVADADDLRAFLQLFEDYFTFFRDEIGGSFSTPQLVRARLLG